MTAKQTTGDQILPQQLEEAAATVLPKLEQFLTGLTMEERVALAVFLRETAPDQDQDTAGYWGSSAFDGWREKLAREAEQRQQQQVKQSLVFEIFTPRFADFR